MKIEIENKTIGIAVGAISAAFSAFFLLNSLHIENHEMKAAEEDLARQIKMSESTRYAEVAKYYRDEMKTRGLTEAEEARLELVEAAQCRIRNQLRNEDAEYCKPQDN